MGNVVSADTEVTNNNLAPVDVTVNSMDELWVEYDRVSGIPGLERTILAVNVTIVGAWSRLAVHPCWLRNDTNMHSAGVNSTRIQIRVPNVPLANNNDASN